MMKLFVLLYKCGCGVVVIVPDFEIIVQVFKTVLKFDSCLSEKIF